MILEEKTFKKFGYCSKDLKRYSKRKILVKCDRCGDVREIRFDHYTHLCKSCTQKGIHPSLETRKKMSMSQTGEKHSQYGTHRSEETKQKISDANSGENHFMYGKHHSDETKKKISDTEKDKKCSEKTKQKMRENALNMPKETRKKISKTLIIYFSNSKNHPCYGKVGKASSAWRGGISYEPYCILFNDEFKERVREYWDRKCVVCKKDEKENGRRLDVHHVTYNKDMCCDDSLPLFIPLCHSCHRKTNGNRKYWENEFKRIMYSRNINGKCFYTKEEMEEIKKG